MELRSLSSLAFLLYTQPLAQLLAMTQSLIFSLSFLANPPYRQLPHDSNVFRARSNAVCLDTTSL